MLDNQLMDRLVAVLGGEPFLTVAELENRINWRGKRSYSTKAFYKELLRLRKSGVVVKVGRRHALRLPWILEAVAFAELLEETYIGRPSLPSPDSLTKKKEVWKFNNLLKMNDFWSHLLLVLVQESKGRVLLGWNPHPWFHLVQTKQEEQYVRSLKLAKSKLYLIVGGNSYLDRWTERFWDKDVVEYSFGKSPFERERATYINVIDDYVLTVKIGPKIAEEIDQLYRETRSMDEINLAPVISLFNQKVKCSVQLEKNPLKAQKIKGKFKRYWGINFS